MTVGEFGSKFTSITKKETDGHIHTHTHTHTHTHLHMGMAVSLLIAGNFNERIYGGPW